MLATEVERIIRNAVDQIASLVEGETKNVISTMRKQPQSKRRSEQSLSGVQARIVQLLSVKPGLRNEQIQKALKLSDSDISLPLRKLVAAKKLKFKGVARGRRYTVR